jgi:hypothetical protein
MFAKLHTSHLPQPPGLLLPLKAITLRHWCKLVDQIASSLLLLPPINLPGLPLVLLVLIAFLRRKPEGSVITVATRLLDRVLKIPNGPSASLPGSSIPSAKAGRGTQFLGNLSDPPPIRSKNAASLPGSANPSAIAGWSTQFLGNFSDRPPIQSENGPAACSPGSNTSPQAKARRKRNYSCNSPARSGFENPNAGPAASLPGSATPSVIAGRSTKFLGNSLD